MSLLALIFVTGFTAISASFWAIREAAKRPANGELHTLARLDLSLASTKRSVHAMTMR